MCVGKGVTLGWTWGGSGLYPCCDYLAGVKHPPPHPPIIYPLLCGWSGCVVLAASKWTDYRSILLRKHETFWVFGVMTHSMLNNLALLLFVLSPAKESSVQSSKRIRLRCGGEVISFHSLAGNESKKDPSRHMFGQQCLSQPQMSMKGCEFWRDVNVEGMWMLCSDHWFRQMSCL